MRVSESSFMPLNAERGWRIVVRHPRAVLGGARLVLLFVAVLGAGCGRVGGEGSAAAETPTSAQVLSAAEEAALVDQAEVLPFFDGEDEPTRVEVVVTTPRELEERGRLQPTPASPVAPDAEVFLVAMAGEFEGHLAKVPEGEAIPKGPCLWFVMDRTSLQVVAWGIAEEPMDLAAYGTASPLPVAIPIVIEEATPPASTQATA